MVITEPMPSISLRFWDDPDGTSSRNIHCSTFPGFWRHGDVLLHAEHGPAVILWQSDATINRAVWARVRGDLRGDRRDAGRRGRARRGGSSSETVAAGPAVRRAARRRRTSAPGPSDPRLGSRNAPGPATCPTTWMLLRRLPHPKTGTRLEVPVERILQGADPDAVLKRGAVDDPEALDAVGPRSRDPGEGEPRHQANEASTSTRSASQHSFGANVPSTGGQEDWRDYGPVDYPRILEAALQAFYKNGYHGTTTRDLTQRLPPVDTRGVPLLPVRARHPLRPDDGDHRRAAHPQPPGARHGSSGLARRVRRARGVAAVLPHVPTPVRDGLDRPAAQPRTRLPPALAQVTKRDEQQRMLDRVILDGVTAGEFTTPYPADASHSIASLCVGVATWYRPDGGLSVEELLKRYAGSPGPSSATRADRPGRGVTRAAPALGARHGSLAGALATASPSPRAPGVVADPRGADPERLEAAAVEARVSVPCSCRRRGRPRGPRRGVHGAGGARAALARSTPWCSLRGRLGGAARRLPGVALRQAVRAEHPCPVPPGERGDAVAPGSAAARPAGHGERRWWPSPPWAGCMPSRGCPSTVPMRGCAHRPVPRARRGGVGERGHRHGDRARLRRHRHERVGPRQRAAQGDDPRRRRRDRGVGPARPLAPDRRQRARHQPRGHLGVLGVNGSSLRAPVPRGAVG